MCRGEIFLSSEIWTKFQREVGLHVLFFGVPLKRSVEYADGSLCVKNQLDPCSRLQRTLACDIQTAIANTVLTA